MIQGEDVLLPVIGKNSSCLLVIEVREHLQIIGSGHSAEFCCYGHYIVAVGARHALQTQP